jgi:hypothetical protein
MTVLPMPGPVDPGQICDPNNISDTDQATAKAEHLVCQLTSERNTYEIPGQFLNALMGDVILSPGADTSGQLVANLLRALTPSQYHSHSGLMTANFDQITHCTASANRIANHTDTTLGVPTQLTPQTLQYAWPGSITQSVDEATIGGTQWRDPEYPSDTYGFTDFTPVNVSLMNNDQFVIVPPLVVKPLPDNEAQARPQLRQAAAIALGKGATVDQDGTQTKAAGCYYSFYCFTKPEISAGFTDPAPSDAGWATGHSPAVCASFIWLAMKAAGLALVTNNKYEAESDFSAQAAAEGADVGTQTLDGLEYYSESQRQVAGNVLYQDMVDQVTNAEGAFADVPWAGSGIADAIAAQMCNMFAFGNPNMAGNGAWENPGDANAVSPDNIQFWNPPYFGYAEPLQYLGPHTEEYTVSRWTLVQTYGTISGRVTIAGVPVGGAYVQVYDGMNTTTGNDGSYTLSNVPTGSYDLKAWVTKGGFLYSNGDLGQPISLSGPSLTVNVDFPVAGADFRTISFFGCAVSCDHGDDNPFNAHGIQNQNYPTQSVQLAPNHLTDSCSFFFNYNGGGYFNVLFNATASLASDLSANVEIEAIMHDSGGSQQGSPQTISFRVPAGFSAPFVITIEVDGPLGGYHNGPCTLMGTVTNARTS